MRKDFLVNYLEKTHHDESDNIIIYIYIYSTLYSVYWYSIAWNPHDRVEETQVPVDRLRRTAAVAERRCEGDGGCWWDVAGWVRPEKKIE